MRGFEIPQLVLNYAELAPFITLAFLAALILTPLVGKLAYRLNALDVPSHMQKRGERNESRINEKITARLGGLAMVGGILFVALINTELFFSWGLWAGLVVLTIVGIYDDIYDLKPRYQFIAQVVAASLVIASGIRITEVQIAGFVMEFSSSFVQIGSLTLILPADIITLIWIVALINFINWISGIDALNGTFSAVAAIAMLLIAMRTGNFVVATLIATYVGAVLGVLPFNYYPSKIFYGFGENINGYLLAVFAILGGSKLAASIIILGLPLLDAVWVSVLRMKIKSAETKNIFKILGATMKSDRNHLHHRLLDVGYSWKAVLFIEMAMIATLSTLAFYLSGFSDSLIQVMIVLTGILCIFAVVSVARRRIQRNREIMLAAAARKPKIEVKVLKADEEQTPEDRYAY